MRGTVYYYYDKVLVTNCKLKSLNPYSGRVVGNSVVQLLVCQWNAENAPADAPMGISAQGDYYLAALPENVTYQIHKSGKLMRVYAKSISAVEETIMEVPMAVLAMLQGKTLLHGGVIAGGNSVYAVIGKAESWKTDGLLYDGTVLVADSDNGYVGAAAFYPRFEAPESFSMPELPGLKGILAVGQKGERADILSVTSSVEKKKRLMEGLVGMEMFSPELKKRVSDSKALDEAGRNVPMFSVVMPEGSMICREELLKLLERV